MANPRLICTASGSALPKKPRQRRKARQAGPKSPPPCRRCVRPKLPKRPNISACQLAGTSLTARKSESGILWKGCKHNRSRSAVTWRARPTCAMTRQPPTAGFARRSSNCKNRLMKQHHNVKLPSWSWKLPVRAPVSPMPPLPRPVPSCAPRQQQELHWPIVLPI